MEFSMINAGLAAGAALAALPVILHLFMRQTPKHVIFPALRLVRERQKRSKKRLRVKTADPVAPYGLTPAAARQWIDNLTIRPVNRPLNSAMGQVYPKVVECDRPRHEVYVLTDLARSSWNPEQPAEGLDRVAKAKTTP